VRRFISFIEVSLTASFSGTEEQEGGTRTGRRRRSVAGAAQGDFAEAPDAEASSGAKNRFRAGAGEKRFKDTLWAVLFRKWNNVGGDEAIFGEALRVLITRVGSSFGGTV
jgi:hypothetical protein